MDNYAIIDGINILHVLRCEAGLDIDISGTNGVLTKISSDEYNKINKIFQDGDNALYENGLVFASKYFSNTNWSFIRFKDVKINDTELVKDENGIAILKHKGKEWMRNDKHAVLELIGQVVDAKGDILIGGLGLGVVALLCQEKPEVRSITVVENNPDIIAIFNSQDFDKSKITVIEGSILDYTGTYDAVLLDYYNIDDLSIIDSIDNDSATLINNIQAPVFNWYGWQRFSRTHEDYLIWKDKYKSSLYTKEQFDYFQSPFATPELISMIESINVKSITYKDKELDVLANEAISLIKSITKLPHDKNTKFMKDYFIYNITTKTYQAIGITWKYGDHLYSAKCQDDTVTDFYEIYNRDGIFSKELDIDTKAVVAEYPDRGDNKIDPVTKKVLQENINIPNHTFLPASVMSELINQNFPYIDSAFYYAKKPYGEILECRYPISGAYSKVSV